MRQAARGVVGLAVFAGLFLISEVVRAQELDPLRPPAIETEGIPVVPPELAERLRQYQAVRTAEFRGWAPDGKGILVRTRFGETAQLHRVYEPGGRREQVTFFNEPVDGRFVPESAEGDLLVTMSRGGNGNDQIYRYDRETGRATRLTDGESRNILGPVSEDGTVMLVASNRRNGRDTDLYVADPGKPDSMRMVLETEGEFWVPEDLSPDGTKALINRYVSINETYPAVLDLKTGEKRPIDLPLPGHAPPVAYGNLAFGRGAETAYVSTDLEGEFQTLARVDLRSNERGPEMTRLTARVPWDVSEIETDPETGRVGFAVNEGGTSALYLLVGNEPKRLDVPAGAIEALEFSEDGKQLGLTLARADAPADAYSVRLDDGELTRWTFSEVGGLDPEGFVAPEKIGFASFDGREIPAFYYRPRGASKDEPAAVLISIHGGPESQYRPTFSGFEQFLVNELGIAVIAPNVRDSAGYGKSYLRLDNAEQREDSVRDIGALLDWIAGRPELDEDRVAVMGGSYGGYMVLGSLTKFPERIKAGVDIVGIANFITFLENTSPYRQDLRRAEYGDERDPEMRKVFERMNPTSNVEKIRSALLVAHGKNDPRVPFSEAEQIAEKVRARGGDVRTLYAENEGHGFAKKPNRDYLTAVIALFLREHLGAR